MTAVQDESLPRLEALLEEQAALRRVATLVAGNPDPPEVFARVCEEVGTVLGVHSTNLTRFVGDGTQTVLGGWSMHGAPVFPVRGGVPLDGDAAVPKVSRSGRPERVDDYRRMRGQLPDLLREAGIASAAAAPIRVRGRLWGAIVASSDRPYGFPPGSEERIASSPSSWPTRSPTRTHTSSSRPPGRGSSRPATPSAGGSSAICTTAPSNDSSHWH